MWTCPKCGSKVDPSFEVCWHCGTSPDGVEDPSFVRADDAGPIVEPSVVPELDTAGVGTAGIASELVECYQAFSLIEATFIADQLVAAGIPALSDAHDMQDALGPLDGNPRVYCNADDLPRARAWLASYETRPHARPGRIAE
jgi:hypothetical protein